MTKLDFGKQLRIFRLQCHDPKIGKTISQQKLGEFLREEMGIRYSGTAISDWERNKSKIAVNDRLVLASLVKILKRHGGIKTLADANLLLEAGNYRAFNSAESDEIFPEELQEDNHQSPTFHPKGQAPNLNFLLSGILFNSPEEFQKLLDEANEGPPPAWPRVAVSLIKRVTNPWSIFHVLRVLIWVWVWVLTYLLITPSLRFPFPTDENALQAMVLYAIGTIILPPVIGATADTNNKTFWKEQKISNTLTTRLYIHQGAYIGFHLGYFILIPLALIQSQLHIQPVVWVEFIKMLIPIAVSYTSAQLVPYNLWLAYERLHLKDGYVFFIFIILGPVWAWFVLEFHSTIGAISILAAITILTIAMAWQYHKKGNTIIPVLWWVIFYGLILICQAASFFIQ